MQVDVAVEGRDAGAGGVGVEEIRGLGGGGGAGEVEAGEGGEEADLLWGLVVGGGGGARGDTYVVGEREGLEVEEGEGEGGCGPGGEGEGVGQGGRAEEQRCWVRCEVHCWAVVESVSEMNRIEVGITRGRFCLEERAFVQFKSYKVFTSKSLGIGFTFLRLKSQKISPNMVRFSRNWWGGTHKERAEGSVNIHEGFI